MLTTSRPEDSWWCVRFNGPFAICCCMEAINALGIVRRFSWLPFSLMETPRCCNWAFNCDWSFEWFELKAVDDGGGGWLFGLLLFCWIVCIVILGLFSICCKAFLSCILEGVEPCCWLTVCGDGELELITGGIPTHERCFLCAASQRFLKLCHEFR